MSGICLQCEKRVRVVVPAGGDGSAVVAIRHTGADGQRCPGGRQVIDWDDVIER